MSYTTISKRINKRIKHMQSYIMLKKIRHFEYFYFHTLFLAADIADIYYKCTHEAAVTYTQELCWQRPCPEHISGHPSPM